MINLAVINLKVLIRRFVKILIFLACILIVTKISVLIYQNAKKFNFKDFSMKNGIEIIQKNIILANEFESNENRKESGLKKLLVAELAVFSGAEEEIMEKENQEEVLEFETPIEKNVSTQTAKQDNTVNTDSQENLNNTDKETNETVQTAIIEANNKKDVYTDVYQTVKIKNESKYVLTQEMLEPNLNYTNTKDIIIYHTHTCESYTPTDNFSYIETGNYRTTDLNCSVVRVGDELMNQLAGKGYTVVHDKTYHDYPAYTGSYNRSLTTIKNLLQTYKGVDAVFDIHRDALRK